MMRNLVGDVDLDVVETGLEVGVDELLADFILDFIGNLRIDSKRNE